MSGESCCHVCQGLGHSSKACMLQAPAMRAICLPASPNWYSSATSLSKSGLLAFAAKGRVVIFDPKQRLVLRELEGHSHRIHGLDFSAVESDILATCAKDELKIWRIGAEIPLIGEGSRDAHCTEVVAVSMSPVRPDRCVSADKRGDIVVWTLENLDRGSEVSLSFRKFKPAGSIVTALRCCPFDEDQVVVGYKNGQLLLLDVKQCNIIQKFVGHEDEIQAIRWRVPPKGDWQDEEELKETEDFMLFASTSKDTTVKIWEPSDENEFCQHLWLPRTHGGEQIDRSRSWISVAWSTTHSSQLYTSGYGGNVMVWTLPKSSKQKPSFTKFTSEGHNRVVFSIDCIESLPNRVLTSSMDRNICLWNTETLKFEWRLPTLGGFAYSLDNSPASGSDFIAIGCGDNTIRLWNRGKPSNPFSASTIWKGLQEKKVTVVRFHPQASGFAYGTEFGRVGFYNFITHQHERNFWSHKAGTSSKGSPRQNSAQVTCLDWRYERAESTSESTDTDCEESLVFHSLGRDGIILEHKVGGSKKKKKSQLNLGQAAKLLKHETVTSFRWNYNGTMLAVGHTSGVVALYLATDSKSTKLELAREFRDQTRRITDLHWNPHSFKAEGIQAPLLHFLLASSSEDCTVVVYNCCLTSDDAPLSENGKSGIIAIKGHKAPVSCVRWCPHPDENFPLLLATGSYDSTAQIWDVRNGTGLANFRRHVGHVLTVCWSNSNPSVVYSGSEDQSVWMWNFSDGVDFTSPPTRKPKKKKKTNKEKHAPNKTTRISPGNIAPERNAGDEKLAKAEEKKSKASDTKLRKTNRKSFLPSFPLQGGHIEQLESLAVLSKNILAPSPEPTGKSQHLDLCFFGNADINEFLQNPSLFDSSLTSSKEKEVAASTESRNLLFRRQSALTLGEFGRQLEIAFETNSLTDRLVALSAGEGYETWVRASRLYAAQLEAEGDVQSAVSYYLACDSVRDAVHVYANAKLYADAVALCKARFLPKDPFTIRCQLAWANACEAKKQYELAAKCYISAGDIEQAIKVLLRRTDSPENLEVAISLAQTWGKDQLVAGLRSNLHQAEATAQPTVNPISDASGAPAAQ